MEAGEAEPRSGWARWPDDRGGPLLSNIYLHGLDTLWTRHSASLGTLVRYGDDLVVMCKTRQQCEEAERRIRGILERLGPGATLRQDEASEPLRWSGGVRFPRQQQDGSGTMPRGSPRGDLGSNPVLRGWGQYFGTGNAARSFNQIDSYVCERLRSLRIKRAGRTLDGRKLSTSSTTRTPSPARHRSVPGDAEVPTARELSRKPCAGNPHARFPRGRMETRPQDEGK